MWDRSGRLSQRPSSQKRPPEGVRMDDGNSAAYHPNIHHNDPINDWEYVLTRTRIRWRMMLTSHSLPIIMAAPGRKSRPCQATMTNGCMSARVSNTMQSTPISYQSLFITLRLPSLFSIFRYFSFFQSCWHSFYSTLTHPFFTI